MFLISLGCIFLANADPLVEHPLNEAEEELFADAKDRRLDSFDLLEAAFIASGADDIDDVKEDRAKLEKTLKKIVAEVGTHGRDKMRGKRLLARMHNRLLKKYDADSTTLFHVIEDGTFNCVSGTVLYNSLAARTKLVAKAVVLPSHVLTLLLTTSGPVEVENTSATGFYENRSDQSYVDFLIARDLNGWNAHMLEEAGLTAPIAQTAEIDNITLVGLIYFNRAVDSLRKGNDVQALALLQRARRLSQPDHAAELREYEASIVNRAALDAAKEGDHERALELMNIMLRQLQEDIDKRARFVLTHNRSVLYDEWARKLRDDGDIDEAIEIYERAIRETKDPQLRYNLLVTLHNAAVDEIKAKDCDDALPYIRKGLALGDKRTFEALLARCK